MDFYGRRSFWSFMEEEDDKKTPPEPPRHSTSRLSSVTAASFSPSSPVGVAPGSPWTFSPLRRSPSPSPSLLYHCLASLHRHDGPVLSLAVSGGSVYTGSDSDRVRVWRQPDFADRGSIRTGHSRVCCLLAHGSALFTSHKDHRVRVWTVSPSSAGAADRVRAKKAATLPGKTSAFLLPLIHHKPRASPHRDAVCCLALFHVEGILYTGSRDRTVKAWRLAERACVDSFVAHEGHVTAMAIDQRDGGLFTASSDGSVKLWRRVYGDSAHALTTVLRFQPSPVNALALSQSHSRGACFLYSGSSDGYVNIWEKEAASGRYNHGGFLQGHRYAVLSLVAVDRVLLSGSEDTTIRVWRREGGSGLHTCLAVMEGHRGPVRCLAVSVEVERDGVGLLLYSASLDRVVKVWRIRVVVGKEEEEEVAAAADDDECGGEKDQEVEYEMSPVLSPLWVEKKLQRTRPFLNSV